MIQEVRRLVASFLIATERIIMIQILTLVFFPIFYCVPVLSLFKAKGDCRTFHERFRARFKLLLKLELTTGPVIAFCLYGAIAGKGLTQWVCIISSVICIATALLLSRLKQETSSYKQQILRRLQVLAEIALVLLLIKIATLPIKDQVDLVTTVTTIAGGVSVIVGIREAILWYSDYKKAKQLNETEIGPFQV